MPSGNRNNPPHHVGDGQLAAHHQLLVDHLDLLAGIEERRRPVIACASNFGNALAGRVDAPPSAILRFHPGEDVQFRLGEVGVVIVVGRQRIEQRLEDVYADLEAGRAGALPPRAAQAG